MIFSILPLPDTSAGPSRLAVFLGKRLRVVLGGIFSRMTRKRLAKMRTGELDPAWKLLNNRLGEPLALPYLMVTAPRWNTHACILTAGPFAHSGGRVTFSGIAHEACRAWALVVYKAGSGETVGFFSSGSELRDLDLDADIYGAGLRLYQTQGPVDVPALSNGQGTLVPSLTIDPGTMVPLESTVFGRDSAFYRLLNAPTQAHLFAAKDPTDLGTAKAYLPVGNPETLFLFGALPRNRGLRVDASDMPEGTLCYLTTYNSASFPLKSEVVHSSGYCNISPEFQDGSFLIRIVPNKGTAEQNRGLLGKVKVSVAA